jgi:hypothetical protein
MFKQELFQNLETLDADLMASYGLKVSFEITIVGSGALILLGALSAERATTDIDVLEASNEIMKFLDRYNMSADVGTFAYAFPQNWRQRRQKLAFEGECLVVYTLSFEDLVISKLMAYRKTDKLDLEALSKSTMLDWERLKALIDNPVELQINFDSESQWQEFLERYEDFKGTGEQP